MTMFAKYITKFPKLVIIIFGLFLIGAIYLIPQVGINDNEADYLPDNSQAKQGLIILEEDFPHIGNRNAKVLLTDKSIEEIIELKNSIKQISGVENVLWLDDFVDISHIEFVPQETIELYYKGNTALLDIIFIEDTINESTITAIDAINKLLGPSGGVGFQAKGIGGIVVFASIVAVLVIILILIICTDSYFSTILILINLGIAIAINFGSNILFKEISDISYTAAAVIQLAVSVDYTLIFLKNYKIGREKFTDIREAIIYSSKTSFITTIASALTTVAGFLALSLMSYRIGAELGLILAKGCIISLFTVIILMPALMMLGHKLIDKTSHKPLLPSFAWLSKIVSGKVSIVAFIVLLGLSIFGYIGQSNNQFTYSDNQLDYTTVETKMVEVFGENNQLVLFVPKGDKTKELGMVYEISALENLKSITNLYIVAGVNTPEEAIPELLKAQFTSDKYSMVTIVMDYPKEGSDTFTGIESIRTIADRYYDEYYLTGESAVIYDIKNEIEKDYFLVIIISIVSIGLIIFLTFKSITMPLILLLVIQSAIWINLAVPYYQNVHLAFLGYILVSSIQLGATIDYAIIITEHYERERKEFSPVESAKNAVIYSAQSIVISMLCLIVAGISLNLMMDLELVKELGILIGRGTLLSGVMSLIILPSILILFDKVIGKTTYKRINK